VPASQNPLPLLSLPLNGTAWENARTDRKTVITQGVGIAENDGAMISLCVT
jgi:hypothetical protein